MKKLHTEVGGHDVQCTKDTIYYSVLTQKREAPYRFFRNDLTINTEVSATEFNRAKYRTDALPYEEGEEVVFARNGDTLRCFFQGSKIRRFSPVGKLIQEVPILPAATSVYSIALDDSGCVWTADSPFHHIGQYDLKTGNKLFELGGSWEPGELNHPEDISIYNGQAFISDMGNQRLVLLDTSTKSFSTYCTFEQPVWQYRRFQNYEVVRLGDGIYIL